MSTYRDTKITIYPDSCPWQHRTNNGTSSSGDFFTNEDAYKIRYMWDRNTDSFARIIDFDSKNYWGKFCIHWDLSAVPSNASVVARTTSIYARYGPANVSGYYASVKHYTSQPAATTSISKPTSNYGGNTWRQISSANSSGAYSIFAVACNGSLDTYRIIAEIEGTLTYRIYTYTVTVSAGTGGTVSGGGNYDNKKTATIKATPSSGYKFVKWSDGNTSAARTVTVTADVTYTATFEKVQTNPVFSSVSITPNPANAGQGFIISAGVS